MSTLTQIAASYDVQPIELATLVGIADVDPHVELSPEETAFVLNCADNSHFSAFSGGAVTDFGEPRWVWGHRQVAGGEVNLEPTVRSPPDRGGWPASCP